jgi:hypothetical protein
MEQICFKYCLNTDYISAYICLTYLIEADIDAPKVASPRLSIIYQHYIN